MRLVSILMAIVVAAALYMVVLQREALLNFAGRAPAEAAEPEAGANATVAGEIDTSETDVSNAAAEAPLADADGSDGQTSAEAAERRIAVVALESIASEIDTAVVLRGRTEAHRQVEVRAETSGLVVGDPLRKGARIEAGDILCQIDPGTRDTARAEAEARLREARASLPESAARLAEAESRLAEAEINDRAARSLSQSGFAAETRVAATAASVSSARAQVEAARTGLESAQSSVESAAAALAATDKDIERLTIRAPFAGILDTDTAELGSLMQTGQVCATVLQLDPIMLVGFVPEASVDRVTIDAPATARLISGAQITGQVTYVARSADPQTRTFQTEVRVSNPDLAIRDGQTAEIAIASAGASAHMLPAAALTLNDAGTLGVRIAVEDETGGDVVAFTPVQILRDTPTGVYATGLPDHARVIVVGQEYVTDGVAIDVTLRQDMPEATQ
ncbi:MAG: efflux RND transporter periplasmic adaptor subunit [Pseudomonadota bacterium]